jgi:hypothetical protein
MPQIRAKTTNIERHRVLLVLKAAGFADAQLGDNFDLQDGSSATSPLALCAIANVKLELKKDSINEI